MAPPIWAYQVDNFDSPPDEELICSVCRSVFCDPVQSPCNHVFCRSCINKWLESNRNCPICRKRTTKYTVQEVVPIVKNMIMKLTLFCHNKEKGCEEKFPLESCESHLKICAYETVRCNNKPCKEMLMRKDLEDHESNNCLHRYIRCQNCCLKISSVGTTKHNCIKALKKRLKEKNDLIKTKNLKIVELQEEIKALKETRPESSDISSLESLSAGDIMINLPSANDSSSDSTSYASESDAGDEDPFQLTNYLSNSFSAFHENFFENISNEEDSIEYPRASSPAPHRNSVVNPLGSNFDDEPQVRRPTKRRLPVCTLDSSEEDNDGDVEPPPAPSPKRTSWRLPQVLGEAGQSSSQGATDVQETSAQVSVENGQLPSSTASCSYDGAQGSNSNIPFKLRPIVRRSNTEEVTSAPLPPARRNSRGIFERTRALLEQYSLESDPEWFPPNTMDAEDVQSDSDTSFRPPVYPDDHFSSSSDSSSSDDDSSSDSSYVDAQSRTNILCGLYSTSSSDDPDWIPP